MDDCYFQRLSSCTVQDTGMNATERKAARRLSLKMQQHQYKVGIAEYCNQRHRLPAPSSSAHEL